MRKLSPTKQLMLGVACGLLLGLGLHLFDPTPETKLQILNWVRVVGRIFLSLIKVILAPLLLTSLIAGVARSRSPQEVGRTGFKAVIYFEIVSTLAILLGFVVAHLFQPGSGVALPEELLPADLSFKKIPLYDQLVGIFPVSIVKSLAENDLVPMLVFSLLFAVTLIFIGDAAKPIIELSEAVAETMKKFTEYVMKFAPFGVAASVAVSVGLTGLSVIKSLLWLFLAVYTGLIAFSLLVMLPIALSFRLPLRSFLKAVCAPALIAFSTKSSEAAYPVAIENLHQLGIAHRIASYILPLGYPLHLGGTNLFLALATVFVAQAGNISLSFSEHVLILLFLMLVTKGIPAIPGTSQVVLSYTLDKFGLPPEGIILVLSIDELMDMARSATNIVGNCLAVAVVAKSEGQWHHAGRNQN